MALYILAFIILLPLIEIAVFIQVGSAIGVLPTVILTVLTAVAGTIMLRQQGLSLIMRMQSEMDAGRVPGRDMMHGALIVLASLFLLIPGFVTDAIGLLLFVPPVRDAVARFIIARANVTIVEGGSMHRREEGVVDLDEGDWSRAEDETSPTGTPRISPWSGDDKPGS
ncbi:FxsA family protein [Roseibium polysiphoniae]|uniref:FxsA family protein n=1 Tax=Roseibium polysiphoniae TaxID=2571221 RepID=A0ABR9CCR9_9HYPH|nr:FxsA family protein [Roseibium polysiphoniae]